MALDMRYLSFKDWAMSRRDKTTMDRPKRSAKIEVRLTEADQDLIAEESRAEDLAVSTWARRVLVREARAGRERREKKAGPGDV